VEEGPRLITEKEAGVYFDEYQGMRVANAACGHCAAQYLAWLDHRPPAYRRDWREEYAFEDPTVRDLSFRRSFDDEPSEEDMPRFRIVDIRYRVPLTVSRGALADLLGSLRRETMAAQLEEVRVTHDERAEAVREHEARARARDPRRS
jgi:hypothetical protein